MSKKKRLIGLLYIAVLCSQGLCAQTRQMGIEELFRLADEQSISIQTYRTGAEAAGEALKTAKAGRLPDVNVSLSASYWGNGKLWDRDFGNAMTVDMPHFGNNFALEAQQVIYAGGAISSSIKQAEIGKALAELDLQKNVQEIRFLLVGHYLNMYKLDNQIRVLQKNMELTEEVIANMKARREQGTVLKNDITRYELQKEQLNLQLSRVKDARKIANHLLVTDNMARYGAAIDNVAANGMSVNIPHFMDTFMSQMTEISIKQMYGWAAYACIILFLLFLLYDAPIRRELKLIPSWQKIRQKIAESFTDRK